jgi:flagella basal body P-ring formation protein FlgA
MTLAIVLAFLQPIACHTIHSDWIRGRDLAAADPVFAAIPADARVGIAPLPGLERLFRVPDLKRIAVVNHVDAVPAGDMCFAWETAVPDRKQIEAAMERALANRNPNIRILETSLLAAPAGEMVFPLASLTTGSDRISIWRGYVRYGETRRFPIWARAIVTVREQRLTATSDLRPADVLARSQLKSETYEGPVPREHYLSDTAQAVGLLLRVNVSAGSPLTTNMLEAPREVNRGDLVDAIVENGAARLEVQGQAENSGRKGEIITVRNVRSGRSFHARVEEKGIVIVVPGGQAGLVVEAKKS